MTWWTIGVLRSGRIGKTFLLGVVIAILGAVLLGVSIAQRKRLARAKVRTARQADTLDARSSNDMGEL